MIPLLSRKVYEEIYFFKKILIIDNVITQIINIITKDKHNIFTVLITKEIENKGDFKYDTNNHYW